MKKRNSREAAIGGLAVVALALVLATSYRSDPVAAPVRSGMYRLLAEFNRIDGLVVGDPVYLSGVRVGTVGSVLLTQDFRAQVAFWIDSGIELPSDTAAAIHTDGLFGSKFVTMDIGGDERVLADGEHMRYTQDAVIVGKLLELIITQGRAVRRKAESQSEGQGQPEG